MLSELINTLLVLGAAQGLFLAAVLASKRTNSTANKILAVAMVAFSIFVLLSLYYQGGHFREYPYFIGVNVPLIYVFGPVLYLYARAVALGGHSFRRTWLLHFLPAAAVTLYLAPFFSESGAAKLAFLERLEREGPPLDVVLIQNFQYPYNITYVVLTILVLRRYHRSLRDSYSYFERINLVWLRNLTIGIVAVWALATGLHLLDLGGIETGDIESKLTPLAVSILVYAIGYLGLRQPEIFHHPPHAPPGLQLESEPESAPDGGGGYEKSGLTHEQAEAHLQRLLRLMEEKQLYKNSLLTLDDLAAELRITPHHLSQVINTKLGKNFYDFVNGYRVGETMRRLRDPGSLHLTILAIALESGFNTKSSFNTFFKKYTGVTPSQYRMQGREAA